MYRRRLAGLTAPAQPAAQVVSQFERNRGPGGVSLKMLTQDAVKVLLDKLCIQYGFCLPPASYDVLVEQPPQDPLSFTNALYMAEGLDPATADLHLYRKIQRVVTEAFQASEDLN